jgi:hypothetical protein
MKNKATILITEGKTDCPESNRSVARIFINRDYDYGYFVPEKLIYSVLTDERQANYDEEDTFEISGESAEFLMKNGYTYP